MDKLLEAIATQVPDLAALLVIVLIFVRYLEKRDDIIKSLIDQLKTIAETLTAHSVATNDAIAEMHRTVARRKSPRPKHRT
jgi:ABC-type transporter Mla subunit MlaD